MIRPLVRQLPRYIHTFASTITIECKSIPGSKSFYDPRDHRIEIGISDLLRDDVSILMHEIAHAWHYKRIKNAACDPTKLDKWKPINASDQKLHDMFYARRNGTWTSANNKTYDQLAVDFNDAGRIEDWKLRELCNSQRVVHYAMCTPDEFFAVLSDMYWLKSDWPPFTREGLKEFDPKAYTMIERLWRNETSD